MKKFKEYVIRLKPYKRKYRIFKMLSFILIAFVFMQIMFLFSYIVPHNNGGYYYFFGGFHKFSEYGSEKNSCLGFVVAAFLIGYIPIIALIPFLYFTIANFLIYEVISEKFQSLTVSKYRLYARLIHFGIIALSFYIITSIFIFAGGGNPFHVISVFSLMPNAFEDGGGRFVGIAAILHIFVGYVFGIIEIVLILIEIFKWIWKQIEKFFNYLYNKYNNWKQKRLEEKLARKNIKNKG